MILIFSDFLVTIVLYFSQVFRFAVFSFCGFAVCVLATPVTTTGGCTSLSIETCCETTLSHLSGCWTT
jgi:hypothetical protein